MPKRSNPAFPDLFPRGVPVVIGNSSLIGTYQGNAGKRWEGERHRIICADGRTRCFYARQLERPGRWAHVGGLLYQWRHTETLEELRS